MRIQRIGLALLALVLSWSALQSAPALAQKQDPQHAHEQHRQHGDRPHGDPLVHRGLAAAAAAVTEQRPWQVRQQLKNGKSIEQVAQAAGKRAADVLARFDQGIDTAMQRAVANERLPKSVADARATWYKQSARLQIDQPGLNPAFPGLHETHVMLISAAVRVSGLPRATIRAELESCKTLAAIVATKGKTGADLVAETLARANPVLDAWVSEGKLTTAQRDEWRAALEKIANNMVNTPGLHVAGKECAP
jgi:hypothetical protein